MPCHLKALSLPRTLVEKSVAWRRCVTRGHGVKDKLDCNHATDRCHLKSITINVTQVYFVYAWCSMSATQKERLWFSVFSFLLWWNAELEWFVKCLNGHHAVWALRKDSICRTTLKYSFLSQTSLSFKDAFLSCIFSLSGKMWQQNPAINERVWANEAKCGGKKNPCFWNKLAFAKSKESITSVINCWPPTSVTGRCCWPRRYFMFLVTGN